MLPTRSTSFLVKNNVQAKLGSLLMDDSETRPLPLRPLPTKLRPYGYCPGNLIKKLPRRDRNVKKLSRSVRNVRKLYPQARASS